MATLVDGGFPNLVNLSKRLNPDGQIADIVDVMSKKNPILDDVPWVEGNLPTGHQIVSSLALPSPSWRKFNAGVAATKADVEKFVETCGMLEDESKVDCDLAMLNGNAAAYRASEDKLKKESFAQTLATALFYESASTNPERIHGLSARYAATTGYTASSYVSKLVTGGSDGQSIWLVTWEPRKLYGIYPKGSLMGLQVQDHGKQRVLDGSSNAFWAYVTQMQWKCGIAVEDYRYAMRHQWDPSTTGNEDTAKGVYLAMQDMLNTIYEVTPNTRFYMNRTSKKKLDAQLASNSTNFLEYIEMGGKRVPAFMGVPIRVVDALVAETVIS